MCLCYVISICMIYIVSYYNKLVDDEKTKIVLDFKNLSFISSAGLGSIMALSEDIEDIDEDEGWVKLINLSADVKEIFDTMGFSDLLDIYTDEADMMDDID